MSEHWVVIYLNKKSHTFTATARKENARLSAVNAWATRAGFAKTVVAEDIDKVTAQALKQKEILAYKAKGYQYVFRPPLS